MKHTLAEASIAYPMPKFTKNYLDHFPKKQFWIVEAMNFAVGFVMAVIRKDSKEHNATWYVQGMATLLFVLVLLIAGAWHTIAWVKMRIVEKKRAEYMGITLQEYLQLISKYIAHG